MFSSLTPAHPAWVEIDGAQFRKNLRAIRKKIGSRKFCLPVKGNAYGHGLVPMARIAEQEGIDCLGVAFLKEAIELRLSNITLPILVFGAIHEDQILDLIAYDLEFSISSSFKAHLVAKTCEELHKRCRVHLEVDTGMRRTGVRPETAPSVLQFLQTHSCFEVIGIYSHFATADQPNHPFALQQITAFRRLQQDVGAGSFCWHLANSGGTLFYPESHLDMVRPGILAYGYVPDERVFYSEEEIAPCLSLKARVSYFKVVGEKEGISYGHRYQTQKQTRVVTIPLGYGDGYRRMFTNVAPVLIRGKKFFVSGTVCMDQFMVDIGEAESYVGDEVVLIGKQAQEEISLIELARIGSLIPHEILCGLSDRLPRVYIHETL